MDVSGSMTGQRKDIARHVVYNILDTLGTNDFVNIYKFDEKVEAGLYILPDPYRQILIVFLF